MACLMFVTRRNDGGFNTESIRLDASHATINQSAVYYNKYFRNATGASRNPDAHAIRQNAVMLLSAPRASGFS